MEMGPCTRIFSPENMQQGGLNISRTLGDFWYKKNLRTNSRDTSKFAINTESDVKSIKFFDSSTVENDNEFDFILIGCDGIWEGGDVHDSPPSGFFGSEKYQ